MQISFALRASVFCKISGALKEGRKDFEMKDLVLIFPEDKKELIEKLIEESLKPQKEAEEN